MSNKPLISVVMSVYNGEKYLRESIDSILNQTFTDFEFIIINDGSTDSSKKIITSYDDKRIRLIDRENQGLVASLNEGIGLSRGKYIARQDDDDVSLPNRFALQVAVLGSDISIVALGSSIHILNEEGQQVAEHRVLLEDREIRDELLIRSPFAHGSVMYRKDAVTRAGLYQKIFWPAEDYDLWVRLALQGRLLNIDEPLYEYRVNTGGISAKNKMLQIEKKELIRKTAAGLIDARELKRKDLNSMINRYAIKPDFFYRKRLELLLANYFFISRKQGAYRTFSYILQLLVCSRLYVYGFEVCKKKLCD